VANVDREGRIDVDHFRSLLTPSTRLVAIQHASNVTGADSTDRAVDRGCQERRREGARRCRSNGGTSADRIRQLGIALLACSGHKGLLGRWGRGCSASPTASRRTAAVARGTGSSELDLQPESLPDKYDQEITTHRVSSASKRGSGLDRIAHSHHAGTRTLTQQMLDGLQPRRTLGPRDAPRESACELSGRGLRPAGCREYPG
jgi:hypothetical protein